MKKKLLSTAFIAAASAAVLISTAPAKAATMSGSVDFVLGASTGPSVIFPNAIPSRAFSAALPLFDPSLGTLRQVDLEYNFDVSLDIRIQNYNFSDLTGTIGAKTLEVRGNEFFPNTFDPDPDRLRFNSIPETDYTAPAATTFGPISARLPGEFETGIDIVGAFSSSRPQVVGSAGGFVIRPQGDVTPFIGTGLLNLDFLAATTSGFGELPFGTGSVLSAGTAASVILTVEGSLGYEYEFDAAVAPIPVPAALPLFLSGLIGMGLIARRWKKNAA